MSYLLRKLSQLYFRYPLRTSLVILALLLTVIVVKRNLFINMFYGPFEVTKDYVLSVKHVDDNLAKSYVSFDGDSIYHSGFELVILTNDVETARSNMLLMTLGNKLLLVKRPNEWSTTDLHVSGELFPILKDEQDQIISPLVAQYPELKDKILPFSVLETKYHEQGKLFFAIFFVVVFGICFAGVALSIWRRGPSQPKTAPGFYSNDS